MPRRCASTAAEAIAAFFRTRQALGLDGGMLVANPVPAGDEIPAAEMAGYIEAAQKAAEAKGISGKAVTPFLLGKILELTDGASLKTNIALVENNARLAARIAKAPVARQDAATCPPAGPPHRPCAPRSSSRRDRRRRCRERSNRASPPVLPCREPV